MTSRWQYRLIILALLGLCAALYFPGLHGPMVLDDFPQLEGLINSNNRSLDYLLQQYLNSSSGPLGRPVAMFSFILDSILWGNQLWHWKLTNVILHLFTVAALYWLTHALFRYSVQPPSTRIWIALFVCTVWALHPLHVSTVLYTVQRMTILSALFSVLSMAAYLEGRYRLNDGIHSSYSWFALSIAIFLPLATFSKENGLLIPAYLILLEALMFPQSLVHRLWRNLNHTYQLGIALAALALVVVGLWFVVSYIVGNGYAMRPFTLYERVLTELRVLVMYVVQVFAPSWSTLGFFHDDLPPSAGLFNPISTLYSLFLLAGLLLGAIALRTRNSIASFGILLFFSSHLMESTIFPLELMFEHRNYLGSFGIILAITALVINCIVSSRLFGFLGGLIIALLTSLLLQFTYTWGNKERLDTQLYAAHPDSPSAIAIMADQYVDAWSPHLAWELLDRPERAGFKLQTLVIKCRVAHQLEDKDLQSLNSRLNTLIQSYELTGLITLSNQWLDKQCNFSGELFLNALTHAIQYTFEPHARQKLMIYKAYFVQKSDNTEHAITILDQAFITAPDSPMPLFIATEWLLNMGDKDRAKQYYQRAIIASDNERAITAEYRSYFKDKITP